MNHMRIYLITFFKILAGAEINAQSVDSLTALHIASYNNHDDLAGILLENGADPNLLDNEGNNGTC
jgi:ankyrin repeat protein